MSLNSHGLKEVEEVLHQEIQSSIKDPQLQTASATENDLDLNLKLASQEVLERAQQIGRSKCPKCSSSRMFYCYSCYIPVETVPVKNIPVVKLPLKIDIIKHPNETDGKSTAVHAKLLAPEDVTIYTYPCIPEYEDKKHEIVLVFPGPNSVSVEDCLLYLAMEPAAKRRKCTSKEEKQLHESKLTNTIENTAQVKMKTLLRKVVFIDSTWNQTNKIISDERLQGLVQVELKKRKTCFWRHQKGKPDTYLSTIEAIYYFLVDYHSLILKETYKGEYDNLLFFFSFMYKLIKTAKHSTGKV
ncbi:tRNA-uridine aminocarboxypropyltransferase 1 [Microcaecilia unicolor]|uniref:tRNA-uridine aminocarboxypropyltransferase 1 n=1 Tax=Microcaecilia unicolor TaxID=1415580 RepID=A0A6P7WQF7_9AMPH|nr:DTW domain-containing protein 1 [Microcaecilia unicolor]XP_030045432.1 DTW domain-containing protein 1 [Microcaecilia unicolor]XP_030045433.1 DTW domain-containing protein 1 [Microcaecilia unicolor]